MQQIELDWQNDEGEPVKSVVLNESEFKIKPSSKARLSGRNESILSALYRALDQHGVKPSKEITERFGGFGMTSAYHQHPAVSAQTQPKVISSRLSTIFTLRKVETTRSYSS